MKTMHFEKYTFLLLSLNIALNSTFTCYCFAVLQTIWKINSSSFLVWLMLFPGIKPFKYGWTVLLWWEDFFLNNKKDIQCKINRIRSFCSVGHGYCLPHKRTWTLYNKQRECFLWSCWFSLWLVCGYNFHATSSSYC